MRHVSSAFKMLIALFQHLKCAKSTIPQAPALQQSLYPHIFVTPAQLIFFRVLLKSREKMEKLKGEAILFFNLFFYLPLVFFAASQPLVGVSRCFPQGMQQRHICNWTAVELLFPFGHEMQNTIVCLPCLPLLGLSSHKGRISHFLTQNFGRKNFTKRHAYAG